MKLANKWTSNLLGKDKQKSEAAAKYIFNTPDIDAWKCLIEKSEYIFSFIKEKAIQNIVRQINKDNYKNIFKLFKYHYSEFDDYLAEKLSSFANEELNIEILELLKNGNADEKAYAAKYFSYVYYIDAANELLNELNNPDQSVKVNAAQALGSMNDETAYKYLIEKINSDDDWAKADAAQLLACYGNKDAIFPMLEAMANSSMPEHIAGEIATLVDPSELLDSEDEKIKKLSLDVLENIISAIPEIWPLDVIIDFKFYEIIERLVQTTYENPNADLAENYALLLLKIKSRINLLAKDSQYTFDQEKHLVKELNDINSYLNNIDKEFWDNQLNLLYKQMNSDEIKVVLFTLNIIKELKPDDALPHLLELLYENTDNELLVCESILVIEELGYLSQITNQECLLANIKDVNLAALARNAFTHLE